MPEEKLKEFWLRKLRLLRWKLNFAQWLSGFTIVFAVILVVAALMRLVLHRLGVGFEHDVLGLLTGVIIASLSAWFWKRHQFFSMRETARLLDDKWHLHQRLECALDALVKWPEIPDKVETSFQWSLEKTLGVLFTVSLVFVLSGWIPVKVFKSEIEAAALEAPLTWRESESWLEELKEKSWLDEEKVENYRNKHESLLNKNNEKWYEHSSLEAMDTLNDELRKDIEALAEQLSDMQAAVDKLADQRMSKLDREDFLKQCQQALAKNRMGSFPLDPALLARLQNIKPGSLPSMGQCRQLSKQLGNCMSSMGQGRLGACFEQRPGRGGIKRGPGEAPLQFGQESRLGTQRLEGLSHHDLKNLQAGESVKELGGKHEIDPKKFKGPVQGGDMSNRGRGGEQVWRNRFMPKEKKVLEKFFK